MEWRGAGIELLLCTAVRVEGKLAQPTGANLFVSVFVSFIKETLDLAV
jgi:hypothetical protein